MSNLYTHELVMIDAVRKDIVSTETIEGDFFPLIKPGHYLRNFNGAIFEVTNVLAPRHDMYRKCTTRYVEVKEIRNDQIPNHLHQHENMNNGFPSNYDNGFNQNGGSVYLPD